MKMHSEWQPILHVVNVLTFEREVIRLFKYPPQSHPQILRDFGYPDFRFRVK